MHRITCGLNVATQKLIVYEAAKRLSVDDPNEFPQHCRSVR